MKSTFLKYAAVIFSVFVCTTGWSQQQYPMQNGTINTCGGTFFDDGLGAAPYSNNDYVFTLCPDNPGDVIQVHFFAFSLWQSPNPNNSDRLYIFDGPDASAPSLGSYTGSEMQGFAATATINNPSGCLTFVFSPNPNGPGAPGWEGLITCTTPCAPPTSAAVITDPAPSGDTPSIGACMGDVITFSDNGSTAQPGFTIDQYVWNFGDGSVDSTSGPEVTHVYEEPGEYLVTLRVIDNNGCTSLNLEPMQVLISTLPIFNTVFDETICLGATATIDGSAIQSTTWSALPPQVSSGSTYLPDGAGFSYENAITFDFFEPGAELESCDDLLDVFINMEHSYMGDLEIKIACPNGTTVVLLPYPNGGGGMFFGEAVDNESTPTVPGEGYTYHWSPTSTNGTVNNQPNNTITYIDNNGATVTANVLPEGTYEATGDLCELVGCPLNGDWTLIITDNLNIDNGNIFFWGLNLNPELFPGVTTFTPQIGMGADSSFWSGPNITPVSEDGNIVHFTPTSTGDFDFTFQVTNNFGCTQDTTVTVTVVPGPETSAGEDLVLCQDSLQLNGGVVGIPPPPPNCQYTLEMVDTWGDGWNGFTVTVLENGGTVGNYTFTTGSSSTATIPLNHGAQIQINASGGTWNNEVAYYLYNPAGELVFSDEGTNTSGTPIVIGTNIWNGIVDCQPESPDYEYLWNPVTGLSDPHISNPMVMVDQNTTYTLTVWETDWPECATTDEVEVTVEPDANPGQDNEITICYNTPVFTLTDSLHGTPVNTGVWTDAAGNEIDPVFTPSNYQDGGVFNYTYTVTFGPCVKSANLTINLLEAGHEDCCLTSADAGPDAVACDLSWQLSAGPVVGDGSWSGPAEAVFENANDPNTTVTVPSPGGVYQLIWTDNNGFMCEESDVVEVIFMDPVSAELNIIPAGCPDSCNATAIVLPSGGMGAISYVWNAGQEGYSPDERTGLCEGEVSVMIEDEYGCSHSVSAVVSALPAPEIQAVSVTEVSCYGECDGQIMVLTPDAISFSFDGGNTYGNENFIDNLCPDTYSITVLNEVGCPNYAVATITEPAPLVAEFSMHPSPTNWTNTTVTFYNHSHPGPIASYNWIFDTVNVLGTSTAEQPTFTFPDHDAGVYPVQLCVENQAGCVACTSHDLVVNKTLSLYVPNSFTPNGDGINDIFKAYLSTDNYSNFRMRIFNRYGEMIFESLDPNTGWDGSDKAGVYYARDEVYVFDIQVTDDITREVIEHNGHLTILR